jgi:hypothetical protein
MMSVEVMRRENEFEYAFSRYSSDSEVQPTLATDLFKGGLSPGVLRGFFSWNEGLAEFIVETVMKCIGGTWRSIQKQLTLAALQIDPQGVSVLPFINARRY